MNKGVALITSVIIALLLFSLVAAFLILTTHARLLNARYQENLMALGLAEAGIDYALWEINFGGGDFSSADGWSGVDPKTNTITDFQDTDSNIYGDINIWVHDPDSDSTTIISEGAFTSISGPVISRKVRVAIKGHKVFDYAILTVESIDMVGTSATDSYISLDGPYGGSNVYDNGDIVTNGDGDPAISLTGSTTVNGDANTGSGGVIDKVGGAGVTGSEGDTADEFIPPVQIPDEFGTVYSSGPLSLGSHDSQTLYEGYYIYDEINLSGHSQLNLNGDVNLYIAGDIQSTAQSQIVIDAASSANIYFDGDVSITGNGVWNMTTDPSELALFGTGTSTAITLSGGNDFYGTIYAPSADLDISGGAEIYGAIAGKTAKLSGGAKLHFDEQLLNDSATMGFDPYAWQETD